MNWDAIGALAELLGALGVIFSLVYLARQIRQNTRVQRRANVGEIAADLSTTLRGASGNPEMSELVMRAFSDLGSLNPTERYRFDCFLYTWLAAFERALLDAEEGEYPSEFVDPIKRVVAGFLRTGGGRAWWDQRRSWLSAPGQQLVDAILGDDQIDDWGSGPVAERSGTSVTD